ncbi:MAG: diaminopimelate epimerase [Eubacteriaceae bacterium]|jgi:diaminopimelate epimerase|nr:diaminopimelate epimerase [Eubacteriaceae bacterium]
MKFTKMHGTGNDFVVIDNTNLKIHLNQQEVAALCDRHKGIGADGLILVEPSKTASVFMNYYNSDGTIAQMCGNGVRCLSRFVREKGIVSKDSFDVETRAGIIGITLLERHQQYSQIQVDMGRVSFNAAKLPVEYKNKPEVMGEFTKFDGITYQYGCASMGNPHMVVLVNDLKEVPLEDMGAHYECHPMFPEKCNISFAQVLDENHIRMDTWERGAGKTLACGTGTCSSVAVLHRLGKVGTEVEATLSGGVLKIVLKGNEVFMTGPAVSVFEGTISLEVNG